MIDVFNDAKRMTLSASSFPSRQISHQMASKFKNSESLQLSDFDFQYLTPENHADFLDCIVQSDFPNVRRRLRESLAISIRLDGPTDSTQQHKVYALAQVIDKDANIELIFLGFGTPKEGDGSHYLQCLQNIPEQLLTWEDLFALISSAVTDGESLNSGHISGLCTRLLHERLQSVYRLPFIWIWCIAHRVNLAFNSLSKINLVASAIKLCSELSIFFHRSGSRTLKLKQIAKSNNFEAPLRYPKYFEVRWSEFVFDIFTVVLRNWRACVTYLQSTPHTGLLKQLLSYDRLHFLTFMTDLMEILKKFQKKCQSDSICILELLPMKDELFRGLEKCKDSCVEGGWEQQFLVNLTAAGNDYLFYGFKLTREGPLRNGRQQCLFTDTKRKQVVAALIKNLKIRMALDDSLYGSLKPLEKNTSINLGNRS